VQYNYENYLRELRVRLQSSHEVARQKLLSSKIKSKEYYDKDSKPLEVSGAEIIAFLMKLYGEVGLGN
jgi:hypothetical protein